MIPPIAKKNVGYTMTEDGVCVPWDELDALFEGSPSIGEDSLHLINTLTEALINAGAPEWIRTAKGFAGQQGWIFKTPPLA